jgi:hypothetical protein
VGPGHVSVDEAVRAVELALLTGHDGVVALATRAMTRSQQLHDDRTTPTAAVSRMRVKRLVCWFKVTISSGLGTFGTSGHLWDFV